MDPQFQKILRNSFLGALLVWGAFVTIYFFSVPVHQAVLLNESGKTFLETACAGRGFLCNGLLTIPASILSTLNSSIPFVGYAILSVIVLAAFALRGFLKNNDWTIRIRVSPLIMIGVFVVTLWGMLMTLSFSQSDGLPMRTVIEPTPAAYENVNPEGLEELKKNFDALQAGGCLREIGTTVSGARAFNYSLLCIQKGFVTRVLTQLFMLLLIAFNCMVLGRAALHLLRLRGFPALHEGVLSAGLGVCLLIAILWLVAVLGVYTIVAGWAILIGIPVALFPHSIHWGRTMWSERWSIEGKPWSVPIIVGWLLLSLLALNFLNVVRPFPIGWDDLGRYLNQPKLLVSYGHFIPTLATFSWEYVTSLGFLLFGYESIFGATLSMLINWAAGLLAIFSIIIFGKTYLGPRGGVLAALLYYFLPMVGHFSFADMKVDNAIFAVGSLAAFVAFLAVAPPGEMDQDEEHKKSVLPLLILAGILASFAFAMKPTAIMIIMALLGVFAGIRLGWAGFVGVAFLAWALFTKQDVFKVDEVSAKILGSPDAVSPLVVTIVCVLIGVAFLAYALRGRIVHIKPLSVQIGVFLAAFIVTLLPWMGYNNVAYRNWPPRIVFTAPNMIAPALVVDGGPTPQFAPVVKTLPPELQVDKSNVACASTAKVEELDRYWGNHPGALHYLGLPWRAIMNLDSAGYYVTLIPALLLFPLLLLLPFFWTKEGRWLRFLTGATLFMVVQWMFFANGIVWYGLGMFIGLIVGLEALVVFSPTKTARWTMGVLVSLSLLSAFAHRLWQFDMQQNIFEYPLGKVSAAAMAERTIPHYDDIRTMIEARAAQNPSRPYVYRVGTFIPYFIPRNLEVLPLADHQLDFFNCINQERDHAKTLARLQALGFNSLIFDTNTHTIEKDPEGSLHKKVQSFVDFVNTPGLGLQLQIMDSNAGIAFILLP